MKYNHAHILLRVKKPLDKKTSVKWFETVSTIAPSGVVSGTNVIIDGHPSASGFYENPNANSYDYVVPLTRDLSEDEAGKIAIVWDRLWEKEDFVIDFSQHEQAVARKKSDQQQVTLLIASEAAKRQHNHWVNSKVNDHWSYGPRYNQTHRKHPMLLPWDQLSDVYRQQEIDRVVKLFDFLDSINLRLSKK